jgi:hypothetical protein
MLAAADSPHSEVSPEALAPADQKLEERSQVESAGADHPVFPAARDEYQHTDRKHGLYRP